MRDVYQAALGGLARNELEDAISTLASLWEQREMVAEDGNEYEAVLAGGVLLAAHDPLIDADSLDVDPEAILETVSPHRDRLSEPVGILFDYLADETTAVDPGELIEGIDLEAEDLELEELEAVLISDLLAYLQSALGD